MSISGIIVLKLFVTGPVFHYITVVYSLDEWTLYFPFSLIFTLGLRVHFLTINHEIVQNSLKRI